MISIVIIEYYSLDEIVKCINSIKNSCFGFDYEIIISSNSCYPKDKQEWILKNYKNGRWLFNDMNGGFGYGMNQGLRYATGNYLVVMNPDVILKGNLLLLANFLSSHKTVGAVAPQIVGHDGTIQDSIRKFVTPWRVLERQLWRLFTGNELVKNERFDYSRIQTTDWVSGAFIMVKREVYEKVGGFDVGYFMYFEDVDWCTRIWKAGYQVVYCPKVKIEYEGSRSARRIMKYARIFIQSQMRYWLKTGFVFGYPKHDQKFFDDYVFP